MSPTTTTSSNPPLATQAQQPQLTWISMTTVLNPRTLELARCMNCINLKLRSVCKIMQNQGRKWRGKVTRVIRTITTFIFDEAAVTDRPLILSSQHLMLFLNGETMNPQPHSDSCCFSHHGWVYSCTSALMIHTWTLLISWFFGPSFILKRWHSAGGKKTQWKLLQKKVWCCIRYSPSYNITEYEWMNKTSSAWHLDVTITVCKNQKNFADYFYVNVINCDAEEQWPFNATATAECDSSLGTGG